IAEEHRATVFRAFARLDESHDRSTGSFGLGLAIVARIAALPGGSATVDHAPELGGARITVAWPGNSLPHQHPGHCYYCLERIAARTAYARQARRDWTARSARAATAGLAARRGNPAARRLQDRPRRHHRPRAGNR